MSNSVIPSFLPSPYDFTTEENEDEDEDEEDEEENEDTEKGWCVCHMFWCIIMTLSVYKLIGPTIKIDIKVCIG
jgi:hypothetical protein